MSQLATPPGKDGQAPKTILSPNLASTPTYLRGASPARSSPMTSPISSPKSRQYRVSASPASSASTFRTAPSRRKVSEAIAAIKAKQSGGLRSPSPITSPGAASFSRGRGSPATVQDENSTRSIPRHLPVSPRTPGASLPGTVNKPSGTVSPAREPLSPVSTGSTQVQSNQTQSLFFSAFSSQVAAPDIPSLGGETNKHLNNKGSARDDLQIPADLETDSMSDNSDDPVDPTVTAGIGAFIDSLQKKKEENPDISKVVIPAVSTSTDESECKVEPETLAEIGEVIDSIVKKPKEAVDVTVLANSSSDDSSKGERVPEETRAGIGAFIDSLQTKQVTENEKKVSDPPGDKISLYVTSSEESAINSKDSETIAETEEELEKFISNRENKQEEQQEATTAPDTEEIHGVVTDSLSLGFDDAKTSMETRKPDEMQAEVVDYVKNISSGAGGSAEDEIEAGPKTSDVADKAIDELTEGSIQKASRGNLLKINFILKQLMKLYEGDKKPLSDELNAIRLNAESLGIQSEMVENLIAQAAHPEAREIADLSEMASFDDLELQRLLAEDEMDEDEEEIRAFLTRFAYLTVGEKKSQEIEEEDSKILEEKIAAYAKKIGQLYVRGEVTDRVRESMLEEARHNDVPSKVINDLFHDLLLKQAASSDSEEDSPDNMKTEAITESAYATPPEGTTTEDLMVKLAPPEGSSLMEISKVNFIMKKLAALHEDDARPEKEELDEIRRAARRVHIPDDTINDMIEYASLPPVIQSTISEASTFDDDELEKALASDKFNVIKEYDESEDIEAYLKRYAHLARGGHFPQANIDSMGSFAKETEEEEGVEYDADFGYVKAELVPSEEEEWWEGEDLEGMESNDADSEMYSEMSSKLALKESAEPEEEKQDGDDDEESTTIDDILGVSDTNDDESTAIDDILDEAVSKESTESESSEDESLSVNPWTSQDSEDMLSEIYEADHDDEESEQPVAKEKCKTDDLEVVDDESETSMIESSASVSSLEASEEESLEEQDRWWEDDDDDDEPSVASLVARLSSDNEDDDDSASGSPTFERKSDQKVDKEIEIETFAETEEGNSKNHEPNEIEIKAREEKDIEYNEEEEEELEIRDRYVRDPTGKPDWRDREHDYVSSVRIKKYEEKMAKKAAKKAASKGMIEELEDMFENREKYQMKAQRALKQWKNPWNIDSKVTRTKNGKPIPLGGVAAAKAIRRWSPRIKKNRPRAVAQTWRMSYKKRTKAHPGYFNVDIYSLYGTSVVAGRKHSLDGEAWENRDVKQYFLHEKSISFARNWFGDLRRERCNDPYREPVCRPESMEMPMDNVGDDEWDQDWYLTWQCKREMGALIAYSQSEDTSAFDTLSRASSTRYDGSVVSEDMDDTLHDDEDYISDDDSWEELPQCGSIHNVKLKIGERVSRVHHQHTSSLRRSRWRKKYFPRGTFPY